MGSKTLIVVVVGILVLGAMSMFRVQETETALKLQLGRVQFIEDNCVVVTDKTACGACAEHCPTKAVRMMPYEEELTLPELDTEVCVGCGACEFGGRKWVFIDLATSASSTTTSGLRSPSSIMASA